jgi:hypothetical protein
MKLESHKRSVLLSGLGVDEHRSYLQSSFQAKKSKDLKGALVVSKKHTQPMLTYLKAQKVRLYLNDALKSDVATKGTRNVSVGASKKPQKTKKTLKPMSDPMLRFYISTMFQKPNSTFAKDQLKAQGYTKPNVVKEIKRIPFENQKVYLKTINTVWV